MSSRSSGLRALMVLVVLVVAACGGRVSPAPQSPLNPPDLGSELQAGIARADITPPPGLSLFGHGPEGRVSVGTLLRLYCEAFVLTRGTESIALVPCDLGAISAELQRAVAERVMSARLPLGADRIILMATHTHAGPAHYFGARQYGGTFSTRAPGFDPRVLDFLADRIAAAVRVAYGLRAPAKIGWAFDREAGTGLVHNRSFTPFAANRELPPCLFERVCPTCMVESTSTPTQPEPACRKPQREYVKKHHDELKCGVVAPLEAAGRGLVDVAADLVLSVLRIDAVLPDGGSRPMGGFAVFGVHNTGIPNTNDVYHSDIFGYALRRAELELNPRVAAPPVADAGAPAQVIPPRVLLGIAAGLQGDISPAVGYQSISETRRVGYLLGDRIAQAFKSAAGAMGDASFERAYRELVLPNSLAEEPNDFYRKNEPPACAGLGWDASPGPRTSRLCPGPEIGTAAAGGAEDGPTRLRIFPQMTEGAVAKLAPNATPCQGRKLPVRAPTGIFGSDGLDFPSMAPISLVRIGHGLIVAAPFELTTVTGTRIRDRLTLFLAQKKMPESIDNVIMVGLANNYLQYAATSDEYNLQHYEGASTLYGPETARFLGNHFLCLADWLYGDHADRSCNLGQPHAVNTVHPVLSNPQEISRMPDGSGDTDEFVQLTDLAPRRTTIDLWPTWTVRFRGIRPGEALMRDHLTVRILEAGTGRLLDDDNGTGIEVRYDETADDQQTWMARWTPRAAYCKETAYFVIGSTTQIVSKPFKLDCPENVTDVEDKPNPRLDQEQSQDQRNQAQQSPPEPSVEPVPGSTLQKQQGSPKQAPVKKQPASRVPPKQAAPQQKLGAPQIQQGLPQPKESPPQQQQAAPPPPAPSAPKGPESE
jgi:neutral ceramidase